jgi:hypothetical protein
MPIKRRTGKAHVSNNLTDWEWAFMTDKAEPPDTPFGVWWDMRRDDGGAFRPGRPTVAELWAVHGAAIVQEQAAAQPGQRPRCWWRFNAPEPRRRVGGTGEPGRADLSYGIPTSWAWPRPVLPGARFAGGPPPVDPDDPPTFEAEAEYLQRLGLLLPGEAERLDAADFEPEPIEP